MLTGYYLTGPGVERLPKHLTQGKSVKDIQIEARQLSERGGGMTCAWEDGRARLTGRACEMGRGTLAVRE